MDEPRAGRPGEKEPHARRAHAHPIAPERDDGRARLRATRPTETAAMTSRPAVPVVVRAVKPGDLDALDALMSSLDPQARCRRWFTGAVDVHRAAAWAAHPQRDAAVGLVATTADGRIVGHAALVPMDEARGEVCFEVAADWRHLGIAGTLLAELDRRAARRGLTMLVAEVLSENADMLAVLREHGPCGEHRDGDVVEVTLQVGAARARTVVRSTGPSRAAGARSGHDGDPVEV
jgi:GNAT superfamily N-acetyltransferase